MHEDRTGWLLIWDGTRNGEWGPDLLPPRASNPSEVWATKSSRPYKRTGLRYTKKSSPRSGGINQEHTNGDTERIDDLPE